MITFSVVEFGSPRYASILDLRYRLLRAPLGLSFPPDLDESDQVHVVGYEDEKPVAVALMKESGPGEVQMRQVAVEEGRQGSGYGRLLVAEFERVARERGASTVMLHARANVVPFYEKLGYTVDGVEFEEVGIPHRLMRKSLENSEEE